MRRERAPGMKVLHTSDWHLGHRLYNYDRSDEEAHFFGQLAELVARERPDALLVSGDVYHTGTPGNDVAKAFTRRLVEVLDGSPETETVIVAGNHDSYSRLEIDEALWRRLKVRIVGTPGEDSDGVADFSRNVIRIGGKGIVAAVPFCHPRNFPSVAGGAETDRTSAYFHGLRAYVEAQNPSRLPTILMAHLAVGKDTDLAGHDPVAVIGGEECVEQSALGAGYDYVALGHIHCPQWLKGGRVARYCGTPRAVNFDETYPHGVDVVEVAAGKEPELRTEVLEPLRGLKTLGGKSGLPFEDALKELSAADLPSGAYVRLNVALAADENVQVEWTERARKAAADRSLRFCVINPIRAVADGRSPAGGGRIAMDRLRELSDEEVLTVLSGSRAMTDRQKELLRGLMAELASRGGRPS